MFCFIYARCNGNSADITFCQNGAEWERLAQTPQFDCGPANHRNRR